VKAKPVARLECFATAPLGSFEAGNVAIPPPTQKTFDAEGISRSSLAGNRGSISSIRGGL
jgi:hypothetical protein